MSTAPARKLIALAPSPAPAARDWRCAACAKLIARVLAGPSEVTIIEVKAGALQVRLTVPPGALTEITCPRCQRANVHRAG